MTSVAGKRCSLIKPVALVLGSLLLAITLLLGAWTAWILLRPAPAGFAPTAGQAIEAAGQPPDIAQYTIDARSRKDWAYFNFAQGATVTTSQAAPDWDVAFKRTDLLTNGGESNPEGQGGAVDLGEVTLDQAVAPGDGYLPDATNEDRGLENPALHRWYNYDWTSHIITSKNHTYAVRTNTGGTVLLTFVSYYCDDGSPACVTFQYKRVQTP